MELIKVMLDPGHGGSDRYNKGPTGYVEADGVLDISLRLKKKLLATGAFDVKLTREVDATVGVRERGEMAAKWGAKLFISEHTNALNGKTRGTEVYESVDLPDEEFAAEMSKAIATTLGIPNRGGRSRESTNYPGEDYYGVIDAAQDGGVPHILLIETAFHDNPLDEALLKDPNKRDLIAEVQAKVICKKFGVVYPVVDKQKELEKIMAEIKTVFKDMVVNGKAHWANDAVTDLYNKGIVKGDGTGNFNPDKNVTRAEVAVMIDRALKKIEDMIK
jgi:N-acetylmuramoyl-L-alanine amidase